MFKLKDLIDEKKYVDNAYNRSKDRVGAEWGSDKGDGKKKDKKSKEDEPKQAGLGGGWDKHDGPDSPDDVVGSDPERESVIVQGIKQMADKNRERDFGDQEKTIEVGGEETTNLCDVTVPGTNLFCADNKGIPRKEMPQLKSKPKPGGKADRMVTAGILTLDDEGEVNTEKLFMKKIGKEAKPARVKVTELKATQNQLVGKKVSLFLNQLQNGDPDSEFTRKLNEPIIVSRDPETGERYIVDGHHRWAALVAQDIANGGDGL